jgi:hypothetical protein
MTAALSQNSFLSYRTVDHIVSDKVSGGPFSRQGI